MPGLVNDHFHVGLTPFQLGAPDLPLELWLLARMGVRGTDAYLDQMYGAMSMIESGTTTVQTMPRRGSGRNPLDMDMVEQVIKAYQDSGMRVAYATPVADQNLLAAGAAGGDSEFLDSLPLSLATQYKKAIYPEYVATTDVVPFLEEVFSKFGGGRFERIRITLGPRTVYYCSDELLLAYKDLARKHNTRIHIHLLASIYEKLHSAVAWGKSPLQHLLDLEFLGPEVICGHGVWTTDNDVDTLSNTGAYVCHNPSSNLRLQAGIGPLNLMLDKGIRVAIGSDEAGINDDRDLFQEMRMVKNIHRLPGIEIRLPASFQVFQMATENGAIASGFGDSVGTIEPGKRADLLLLDLGHIEEPFLGPEVSVVDAVVHRGRVIDVDTVMVDGEILMRGRQHTKFDKNALLQEIRQSLNRSLQPEEISRGELGRLLEPYVRRFHADSATGTYRTHYQFNSAK